MVLGLVTVRGGIMIGMCPFGLYRDCLHGINILDLVVPPRVNHYEFSWPYPGMQDRVSEVLN